MAAKKDDAFERTRGDNGRFARTLVDEDAPEVNLDEDEDDDDEVDAGEETEEPSGEPGQPPRRERRQARSRRRYDEQRDALERAERRARELEEHNRTIQLQAQQATLFAHQQIQQQQQPPQTDPFEEQITNVQREQQLLTEEYNRLPAEQQNGPRGEELRGKWRDLDAKKLKVVRDSIAVSGQQQPSLGPADVQRAVAETMVRTRYPDVVSNPRALAWAGAELMKRHRAMGQPDTIDLWDAVMDEARRESSLWNGNPPRQGQPNGDTRARYSGMSAGAAGGGVAKGKRTIKMTKEYRAMADAAFPHIEDESERYKTWARKVGPKILERQNRGG